MKSHCDTLSFFKLIFIHTEKHSETEIAQILLHEHTHVRQWYSLDIILIEILFLFCWWNPCVWLMKREMAMNLEYLADYR
ncbi:MAG: M56 family metallopeptidase [Proteiniphilum sp.]|nr:M56 family metallopeptidase [Proteiniphilum sp.]